MELDTQKYEHTHLWFLASEIKLLLPLFVDFSSKIQMLEIGSFEGLSSCCFSDNVLQHTESTLDCVDPFHLEDKNTPVTTSTELFFKRNIARSKNAQKCRLHQVFSDEFFQTNEKMYDVIYIDGSHTPVCIRADMLNSFRFLHVGGIMWMDDYLGGDGIEIKNCIDLVLQKLADSIVVIHTGYQIAIRKIK